jgi:hypothetical protein
VFWIASAPRLRTDFGNFHRRLQRMQENIGRKYVTSDFIYDRPRLLLLATRRWRVLTSRLRSTVAPERACGREDRQNVADSSRMSLPGGLYVRAESFSHRVSHQDPLP